MKYKTNRFCPSCTALFLRTLAQSGVLCGIGEKADGGVVFASKQDTLYHSLQVAAEAVTGNATRGRQPVNMRHLVSDNAADLAAIGECDVELVTINRPATDTLSQAAAAVLACREPIGERWRQSSDTAVPDTALPGPVSQEVRRAISLEISSAVASLESYLGCVSVEVKLDSLRRPMCPLFHVDQIRCRLLITLTGPGTEWLASNQPLVNGVVNANRVQRCAAGSWSLLKGGSWGRGFSGVRHRSPQSDAERLLVALDPEFA